MGKSAMFLSQQVKPNDKSIYDAIIDYVTTGQGAGAAYNNLANFVDHFGPRLAGSQQLENAIDSVVNELQSLGRLQVHTETFSFEGWQRGSNDSAQLLLPFSRQLPILALGGSISTGPDVWGVGSAIEADCAVVESFDELDKLGEAGVSGKIVVYNQSFVSYPVSVAYRVQGASRAAKYGALAAMVRSVTPFSIGSPHTGWQEYEAGLPRIPVCSVTVEDAEIMYRSYKRGDQVRVRLELTCGYTGQRQSRNIVADLVGSEVPDELVVICGHIDSWDVGEGAMDDGGGAFCAKQALLTLLELNLPPRRTVRLVLFSAEEFGILGGIDYYQQHKDDLADKISLMLESDGGTFSPQGVVCSGSSATRAAVQQVLNLLQPIGATTLIPGVDGPDISIWADVNVPVTELVTGRVGQPDDFYFYFHHTQGDTMTVQNSAEMDKCVAAFAVIALAVANADSMVPRQETQLESHSDWEMV